jgi:3-oxoacyl-[acyl-carrier protein] reductase
MINPISGFASPAVIVPQKFAFMRFKEKIALITGGIRGIGSAIGKRFLQEGAQVVVTYSQDKDQARKFQHELGGAGAQVHQADASDFDQMKALFDHILKQFGRLDILVNNAGIRRDNLVMFMSDAEWHDVLRVNLKGTFICSKLALKPMIAQRWGRVINVVSPSSIMGREGQANYAAAKGGVASFTKSLAREVGKIGITVNAVSPGVIDTDMTRSLPAKTLDELKQAIPMGHLGQPEDVSGTVLFLASDEASYITGQVISVDGGLT